MFFVEILISGLRVDKIVINIFVKTQSTTLVDAAPVEEFNTVTQLHTEEMIIFQVTLHHLPAVTHQTRFMRLAANVTLIKMSRNIAIHSVQETENYFLTLDWYTSLINKEEKFREIGMRVP